MKTPTPRLRLRLRPAVEAAVRGGHPWIYAEAIREQNRNGTPGELAVIYDRRDKFLAVGLYDPESPIRVRILHTGQPVTINEAWWAQRLEAALGPRRSILDESTTGCRLIYGESDGWPGLVLDQYGTTLVLKLYTAVWFEHLPWVTNLLTNRLQPARMVLRLSRNVAESTCAAKHAIAEGVFWGAPLDGTVTFLETGLHFEADVLRGQKTGFFLDQRENRRFVEASAKGKRVLNTFSFSGAFSVYAARGSATSVTDVDISQHALDSSSRNFGLNQKVSAVRDCPRHAVKADVFDWLKETRESFDLVILDPPSLARREAERSRAIQAYNRLAALGIERLAPGGTLAACSCSAHVSTDEFKRAVLGAAEKSGRRHRIIRIAGHPPDHTARFPEAEYLKAVFLRFDPER
jgi:23S rRNA (cytosine1962-C5)-methyltransferase